MNVASFTHEACTAIMRIADAFNKSDMEYERRGGLFSAFDPIIMTESSEQILGGQEQIPVWLNDRALRWGTKWDVSDEDLRAIEVVSEHEIRLQYDTAWTPPIPFYNTLLRQGYSIHAYYLEPDEGYCGEYHNGRDLMFENLRIEGKGQLMRTKLRIVLQQFGRQPQTIHEVTQKENIKYAL